MARTKVKVAEKETKKAAKTEKVSKVASVIKNTVKVIANAGKKNEEVYKNKLLKSAIETREENDKNGNLKKVATVKINTLEKNEKIQELLKEVAECKRIETLVKSLNNQVKTLKEHFKQELTDKEIDVLYIGNFKVNYSQYTSTSFNADAFKEAHPKLYAKYYTKETTSVKVTVDGVDEKTGKKRK